MSYPTASREDGARTRDLRLPKPARFQLRYLPALLRPPDGAKTRSGPTVGTAGIEPAALQEPGFTVRCGPSHSAAYPLQRSRSAGRPSAASRTRTPHLRFWRPPLYQLSYRRMRLCLWADRTGGRAPTNAPVPRGRARSRTGMSGIAIRCLTTRPRDQGGLPPEAGHGGYDPPPPA